MGASSYRRILRRAALCSVLAVAASTSALAFAPVAHGAAITRSGTVVTYTAAVSKANNVTVSHDVFGYRIIETAETVTDSDPSVGGCYVFNNQVTCPEALGVTKIIFDVGDSNDTVSGAALTSTGAAILQIDGGTGTDTLTGGSGRDAIDGGAEADSLAGGPENDLLTGGDGIDSFSGGQGNDQIVAEDGVDETSIDCGPGADTASVDAAPLDSQLVSCETVIRPASVRLNFNLDATEALGPTYIFQAAAGQANDLVIEKTTGPQTVRFTDNGADASGGPITIGPSTAGFCGTNPPSSVAKCGVSSPPSIIKVYLDDRDDKLTVIDPNNEFEIVVHGGAGNDTLAGGQREDLLYGEADDDVLIGSGGDNTLDGGDGNDTFDAGGGADTITGGAGFDRLSYSSRPAGVVVTQDGVPGDGEPGENDNVKGDVDSVTGSDHDDVLIGDDRTNFLVGGPGDDSLSGLGGGDALVDGPPGQEGGGDTADGGPGDDLIATGSDDDVLDGGPGKDTLDGGDDTDLADYSNRLGGIDVSLDGNANDGAPGEADNVRANVENVDGGQGSDTLTGSGAGNRLVGGSGADNLTGNAGADELEGGAGDDSFDGGTGADSFNGDGGRDEVSYAALGTPVNASIDGVANDGPGDGDNVGTDIEVLRGGSAADLLYGSPSADTLIGGDGDDALDGGDGIDTISGDEGNDSLAGGAAADAVNGGSGNDSADGGTGNDTVSGNAGDDSVLGSAGFDVLSGGSGVDSLHALDGEADLVSCGSDAAAGSVESDPADLVASDCSVAVEATVVSLAGGTLKVSKNRVAISLTCQRGTRCDGTLSLSTAGKVTLAKRGKAKARKVALGRSGFSIPAGKTQTVGLSLTRDGRRALKRKSRLSVVATATVRGGKAISKTLTLRGRKRSSR